MQMTSFKATMGLALVLGLAPLVAPAEPAAPTIETSLKGPHRSAKFVARDAHRHPAEELAFFGLKPDMSVLEVWPGGGYWTEILAPVMRPAGRYEVALPPAKDGTTPSASPLGRRLASDPALYDKVIFGTIGKGHDDVAPPESADLVLTFRNLHNWMKDDYAPEMFATFFKVLKHGGILGIEEHRGQRTVPQDPRALDGYVRQDAIVSYAKAAGFTFEGSSEINANLKDTANWPRGVWTLPPDLELGETDKSKYEAIGEADNAVLKFRKP